jgi:phage tail sheath protein FI
MLISNPFTPGVKIQEVRLGPPPIIGVGTSTAAFVGTAPNNVRFANEYRFLTSADQFSDMYVDADPNVAGNAAATRSTPLSRAVYGFFANGGTACYVLNVNSSAAPDVVAAIKRLEPIDEITLIAAPGFTDATVWGELIDQATRTGDRFALLDPPSLAAITVGGVADLTKLRTPGSGSRPPDSIYAAFYYPRIEVGPALVDPGNPAGGDPAREAVTPIGHIAGVYARVDAARGVHKAPANETLLGVLGVEQLLTDAEQNDLNQDGVNVLRVFSGNTVVWGARTLLSRTATDRAYLYVNIRRLVNYIEETLQENLRWVIFEPNILPLRRQIERAVRGFLDGVWRDGALFGATADEAYYVRFPELFNRDDDRAQGKLTIEIGLRVAYPVEFLIIRIGLILQSAATA